MSNVNLNITIETPKVPTRLRTSDGRSIPLHQLDDSTIHALGQEYIDDMLQAKQDKLKDLAKAAAEKAAAKEKAAVDKGACKPASPPSDKK